ncbi:MAG: alpha/beta hydrolase [Symploca sp. SIO2E9]|nr:alpha/beta hydrolase [Symploca sp. SIO2E9]
MSKHPDVLWLNTNRSFQCFAQRLLNQLSKQVSIGTWEYSQNQDEPCSLDVALILLHDYLKCRQQPIDLIGHSTGGLLGLLYARQHPERVRSLTLLAVGVHPAVDWQAHYYSRLEFLRCTRQIVLAQMVYNFFGDQEKSNFKRLVKILERDLLSSPSAHSLWHRDSIPSGGVCAPLMVCGSKNDFIVDTNALQQWRTYFKDTDCLWQCPTGGHFFHHFQSQLVAEQIFKFWHVINQEQLTHSLDYQISSHLQF